MQYMKINNKKFSKNISFLLALLCLFTFSFPIKSHAEEKNLDSTSLQMPSFGGKLDLTPQKPEDIAEQKSEQDKEQTAENENQENEQINLTPAKGQKKNPQTKREDIILAPGHNQDSVIMQEEDGSNVIIVHGTNKKPENYTNSTNVNNGFYMNITNPDGSGMNMGTYFNSNSSSNSPQKRSRAQIIVDKKE